MAWAAAATAAALSGCLCLALPRPRPRCASPCLSIEQWREFRARLLDRSPASAWVHELARPELGCLLLAQPHVLLAESLLLHRAVVLVLEHSEEAGTVGLLLATPSAATVGELLKRRSDPRLRPLAANTLFIGGTVLPRQRIRVLTRRCDVAGARRVIDGLYECSLEAAARMVAIGAAEPGCFEVFAAACQWSPEQLATELSQALWLPVAASATAVMSRPEGKHALYFELMESVGGEYLRQAMLARSAEEVDEWLVARAHAARSALASLAKEAGALEPEAVARAVHGLLYPRDNMTDVAGRIDALAEQAEYIWFTRELERGLLLEPADEGLMPERPLKDPSELLPRRPPKAPRRRVPPGRRAANRREADAPSLRVLSAAAAERVVQENALHAINMLLFDLLNYRARRTGETTPEQVRVLRAGKGCGTARCIDSMRSCSQAHTHVRPLPHHGTQTSLPDVIRRNGGVVSLFTLCIVYYTLAKIIGVPLQLVRLEREPRSPHFLLRLEPSTERQEMCARSAPRRVLPFPLHE
eukprot:scaffold99798_cov27-Tisochrysis_lutea.AAC.1